ncbi:unnamed protein product [Closterium sp. NIES-54]
MQAAEELVRAEAEPSVVLNAVLTGADWSKSQVDEALYFKVGDRGVACWVLVYIDDLLAPISSTAMLKELKELLEVAFELREISLVEKYLGLEIMHDRPARKLWLHQHSYVNKLRRRFIDEEQTGRRPNTPISVDAYAELTFDDDDVQSREEEEYRQKVGLLQFAATTTRPDIAFACSKLGSGLTRLRNSETGRLRRRHQQQADAEQHEWLRFHLRQHSCLLDEATHQLLDARTPTGLNVGNQSAIVVAKGLGMKGNLKHMEQRYAWLQQMVKRKKIALEYIPTSEQPAEFLTKVLRFPAFNWCSIAVGQFCLADVGNNDDVQQ